MTAFRQLGDLVCPECPPPPACLCQHHGAAYAETTQTNPLYPITPNYLQFANGATITQVPITITETCCVIVNAASVGVSNLLETGIEIERPVGSARTTQRDITTSGEIQLLHHASWEVLAPGTYTYFLVNRHGATREVLAAWIKAIASDCEG